MDLHCRTLLAALLFASAIIPASAEDGVTDSTILIGQTIGVSGPIAGIVKGMIDGANLYIANVNNHGGVYGRKISVRILDDKFDVKAAAANAEKLIKEEHVFALFQSYGSPQTVAMFPVMAANGVPLVAPAPGATPFHTPFNRLVFNVRAKFQDEVAKGIEQFSTVGVTAIGMLAVDDPIGSNLLESFKEMMSERKLVPGLTAKFDRFKPDVKGAAASLAKAHLQAVIIIGPPQHTVPLIKAIRATGSKMQIMILSHNSSQTLAQNLGPAGVGVLISQIMPAPDLVTSELGQEFKNLAKSSNIAPSYAAMEGFASAKVLVEGLRRAGRNLTREQFIKGLETMKKVDLGGVMVSYSPNNHSGSQFVEMTMINKDGRFVRCRCRAVGGRRA